MRSFHVPTTTRVPVLSTTASTLHTQRRPAAAAASSQRTSDGSADQDVSTGFPETEFHSHASPSRGQGHASTSRRPAHLRSGGGGGGGPVSAARIMQSMRVTSPCVYLTPNTSQVTSALFYGGEGRVPASVSAQLASHMMDTTPTDSAVNPRNVHTHTAASSSSPAEVLVAAPSRVLGRATVVGGHSRAAPYWRSRQYEPFEHLLNRYIERGVTDVQALLTHPDAPSPAEVLLRVLPHRLPCALLTERVLRSVVVSATLGSGSATPAQDLVDPARASLALERVAAILRTSPSAAPLYHTPAIRVALLEALLALKLTTQVAMVAQETPVAWLSPSVWHQLIDAAAHGRLAHSTLLWRLLVEAPEAQPADTVLSTVDMNVSLPSGEFGYAAAHYVPSASAIGNTALASRTAPYGLGRVRLFEDVESFHRFAEPLFTAGMSAPGTTGPTRWNEKEKKWMAMSFLLGAHGVVYGLDAQTTAGLLLRAGPGVRHQASSLLALHIMRRYVRTCELLATEASTLQASLTTQIQQMRQWPRTLNTAKTTATATPVSESATTTSKAVAVLPSASRPGRPSLASAAMPHPAPYLAFFRIAREARDLLSLVVDAEAAPAQGTTGSAHGVTASASSSSSSSSSAAAAAATTTTPTLGPRRAALPMLHWELVWHAFQQLNRQNPLWYTMLPPQEAIDLCQDVIEVLCRGADPWLTLNVARAVSSKHIMDGLDMTLWLLHHLDASHHTQEAKEVTRKLYQWLLVDVGIHLHPSLHHHLIPAARVLIRLGLHDDLKGFYNAVLDNAYAFSESFRQDFMAIMDDLACPACSTLLADHDPYHERICPNCMHHLPAKDTATLPSHQLSAEHVARQRERRLAHQRQRRQRSVQSAHRLGHTRGGSVQDAAVALFHRDVLSADGQDGRDRAPLLPGIAVSQSLPLFPLEDGALSSEERSTTDLRTALEESSRRLDLQRQARAYALAHRGLAPGEAALPSSSYALLERLDGSSSSSSPSYHYDPRRDRFGTTFSSSSSAASQRGTDGPWLCVWCQERNSEWASRLECTACGAETGPSAPWRTFTYATDGDAVAEIRARIANCDERPVEAVMAAYLLMVYRRTFSLAAAPHDHERIRHLVHKLCELHERVLAGFIYTRLVPPPQRRKDENLLLLTQLFEGSVEACQQLSEKDLLNDDTLLQVVFSADTCRVCFGHHDWKLCPIITRDFSTTTTTSSSSSSTTGTASRSRISLSPEEKQELVLKQLKKLIQIAVAQGKEKPKLVVDAYAAFITSPFREVFAEVHPEETNALSTTLSRFKQYRRAAFVLCHIPPYERRNEAYLALSQYFNVTEEEAMALLSTRSPLGHQDASHPNFVQVTQTCCMCLDERHASFACPRLKTWLREAHQLMALTDHSSGSSSGSTASSQRRASSNALVDPMMEYNLQRRLKAQADGWTSAGPERLYAFYRFLLDHVDEELREGDVLVGDDALADARRRQRNREGPAKFDGVLVYAVNKVIRKLATLGKDAEAYRLYAHTPASHLAIATTTALLRLQRFSDEHIRDLLASSDSEMGSAAAATDSTASTTWPSLESTTTATTSSTARLAAVPFRQRCLICFDPAHSFLQCPELSAQASLADRLTHVVRHVGGITSGTEGISGAAAYMYYTYNMGQLPHDLLRDHPALVKALLTLCQRCFASGQVAAGVRVLRRLPIEMVPPLPIYASLWRAAGLPETVVESRKESILALYDSEGIRPSIDTPPPRPTFSTHMMASLGKLIHDDLCRHCYQSGHTLATCSVFHAEVSFGRDYVAAYRMNMMSEQLSTEWQDDYLLKLVEFFDTHRLFMPYHIAGVANALSAIAAMWSFRGEPGIALRQLLTIPPSYRRRQAFKHLLHCLQVPAAEISRLLDGIVFVPDDVGTRGTSSASSLPASTHNPASGSGGSASVAQHLLIPKPAIRDVAMRAVFDKVPAAGLALEECDARVTLIASRNQPPPSMAAPAPATPTNRADGPAWGKRMVPAREVMQSGDIRRLREDFDPILSRLEEAVGMKLGSRHILFTSAVDVLGTAASAPSSSATTTTSSTTPPSAAPEAPASVQARSAAAEAATRSARPEVDEVRTTVADSPRGPRRHGAADNATRPRRDSQSDKTRSASSPSTANHRNQHNSSNNNSNNRRHNNNNNNNNNNNGNSNNRRRSSRDNNRNQQGRRGDSSRRDRSI